MDDLEALLSRPSAASRLPNHDALVDHQAKALGSYAARLRAAWRLIRGGMPPEWHELLRAYLTLAKMRRSGQYLAIGTSLGLDLDDDQPVVGRAASPPHPSTGKSSEERR